MDVDVSEHHVMSFYRFENRDGTVAVFKLTNPQVQFSQNFDGSIGTSYNHELVFNRSSLETRVRNIEASGHDATLSKSVLDMWPS